MKTLIIHHHDLDGFISGDIAHLHFPDAQTLTLNYDTPSDIPTPAMIQPFDSVIIVDYTLPCETMLWLKANKHLIWIDHHFSSINTAIEKGYNDVDGLRCQPGELICGAELSWRYFEKSPLPRFLQLTGDQDTYRNSRTPEFKQEVMPFFYATQLIMECLNPANFHSPDFLLPTAESYRNDDWCNELIEKGSLIQEYNRIHYAGLRREAAFVRNIWGLRVYCFNSAGHGSSIINDGFDPALHDAMMLFSYNGATWSYGIYTDIIAKPQVNLAQIAKRYGGGGHQGAAGFSTRELLPELLL